MERDLIIKALECCVTDSCFSCPYDDVGVYSQCVPALLKDALSLINSQERRIKELTEENKAWQKQLISTEEQAGKAYYDLACEVENLRAENERLHASCTELTRVQEENERLREELAERPPKLIITKLPKKDQIAKEMLEGE